MLTLGLLFGVHIYHDLLSFHEMVYAPCQNVNWRLNFHWVTSSMLMM